MKKGNRRDEKTEIARNTGKGNGRVEILARIRE